MKDKNSKSEHVAVMLDADGAQRQKVLCTGYHWVNVFVRKALVIRSFLWRGLRPGANTTVTTQLEKQKLFW